MPTNRKFIFKYFYFLTAVVLVISKDHNIDCSNLKPLLGKKHPYLCCPIPEFYTTNIIEKCEEHAAHDAHEIHEVNFNAHKEGKHRRSPNPLSHGPCFTLCAFKEIGIIDADMQFNVTALENYLDVIFENVARTNDWKVHTIATFQDCFTRNVTLTDISSAVQDKCNPLAENVANCFGFETFVNCPKKIWKSVEICNEMHDFITNCNVKIF